MGLHLHSVDHGDMWWLWFGTNDPGDPRFKFCWSGETRIEIFRKAMDTLLGMPGFGESLEELEMLIESRGW